MWNAAQHLHGTIAVFPSPAEPDRPPQPPSVLPRTLLDTAALVAPRTARLPVSKPREFFIQGVTSNGRAFRPSDWAERLAGALSTFRPKGTGIGAHIGYSPYCVPRVIDNIKCVIVNEALRDIEPMAWDFAMNFARDNDLQVVEACLLPDGSAKPAG